MNFKDEVDDFFNSTRHFHRIGEKMGCQGNEREEFPKFSKQRISNLLMFHDNFEFLDGTLISLRSLALTIGGTGGDGLLPKSLFSTFV